MIKRDRRYRHSAPESGTGRSATVALLPGDASGTVVTDQAARVLRAIGKKFGHSIEIEGGLYGALAIDRAGTPLPAETLALAERADALLLGGGASAKRWEDPRLPVHPAQATLELRQRLGLYANLRPVRLFSELADLSSLKPELVRAVDLLLVREVSSGVYFGKPKKRWQSSGERRALDTTAYSEKEIVRVLRFAFELAQGRRRRLTSVDKANVLATSKLWREIANELAAEYSEVSLEHMLVDNCAVYLMTDPGRFDVIVTENLFGYILQDVAGALAGAHGLLPGGSLGTQKNTIGFPVGVYEPTRAAAPQAEPEKANPVAAILSAAMLLRHSLGLEKEAAAVEGAVSAAVRRGFRTADIARAGERAVDAAAMTDAVLGALEQEKTAD
ncbi:MAG TPA: 3-isopropylmalate dehydrogenase [Candidatus Acidoferrales bacterium]|nr:3-isopropylmalate dehydrogenase [Candidatus Acidoferrales bacterium]